MNSECPLCGSEDHSLYASDQEREYRHCPVCKLIFVPKNFHLNEEKEKAHYQTHENDSADQGYRRHLDKMVGPLCEMLPKASQGLDFGSGPGPTLSLMMIERGHQCENYDPYFYPCEENLERSYDYISLTEVIEHLSSPREVLENLLLKISKNGLLGVMTQPHTVNKSATDFLKWYYKKDPTHITFFCLESFTWIALKYDLELSQPRPDIFIFRKNH